MVAPVYEYFMTITRTASAFSNCNSCNFQPAELFVAVNNYYPSFPTYDSPLNSV